MLPGEPGSEGTGNRYRPKYDAAKTLAAFAAAARDQLDLDALTAEILRVAEERMQPTHLSLWLKSIAGNRPQTTEPANGGQQPAPRFPKEGVSSGE